MNKVRVRIAPSPTGEDLHIGNVYTTLLNYVFARKNKGKFIIRIEDTDRTRYIRGSEERILKSLSWLGLNHDEGPDKGGPYGPYRQSERLEMYKSYVEELIKRGKAYFCYCTPERLEEMRKIQLSKGLPTLYDGKCKKKDQRSKIKDQKYVIRLNVPEEGKTEFEDVIRGKISFENKLIDDQVILKSDGYPTYHLAVVVDDALMKISHVIRAEEWISSTPKHILLYKYLGWDLPVFAHGPILRNPDRSKLSKRKNPVWTSWYKKQGFLPEAILNYLALMGWSMSDGREIFSLDEMVKYFELKDLKAIGPSFDMKKLEWMCGEYIRQSQNSNLKTQIYEFYERKYSEDLIGKTVPLIRERIKKLSDYLPLCEFFFQCPQKHEIDLKDYQAILQKMAVKLGELKDWQAEKIGKSMQDLAGELKIKNSEFFMVLRVAVTGKKISPPLNESMEILGREDALNRLHAAASYCYQ